MVASAAELKYRLDVDRTRGNRGGAWLIAGAMVVATGCPAEDGGVGETDVAGTSGGASTGEPRPTGESTDPSMGDSTGTPTTDGAETSADDTTGSDETGETSGGGACGEPPTRMMFFGDSLFACFGQVGEKNAPSCSARLGHEYLSDNYAPEVTYENLAVSGAVTADVINQQMPGAPVGMPGHTLVVIWVGGNDISGLLLSSDAEAEASYRDDLAPRLEMYWDQMLAWVDDPANFPDGATLVINTQFNPFDDCSQNPYAFMSPLKTALLAEYNDVLRARVAGREDTYLSDQYPVFLGHGHHYATQGCPNYEEGSAYWMIGGTDLVHPNGLGHVSIAGTLDGALDEIYACD